MRLRHGDVCLKLLAPSLVHGGKLVRRLSCAVNSLIVRPQT